MTDTSLTTKEKQGRGALFCFVLLSYIPVSAGDTQRGMSRCLFNREDGGGGGLESLSTISKSSNRVNYVFRKRMPNVDQFQVSSFERYFPHTQNTSLIPPSKTKRSHQKRKGWGC